MFKNIILFFISMHSVCLANAQFNPMYANLPLGKYAVGFKIITLTDSSRVTKPLYNYFGEKETGDRYQKISIHIWYPAESNSNNETVIYKDYYYAHLLNNTSAQLNEESKSNAIADMRNTQERFFGKITDDEWKNIITTKMLAQKDAKPLQQKFPLLIGELRPLSTSVTNEMMASNGYVVAMAVSTGGRLPLGYVDDIADMRQAIAYLTNTGMIDENNIGTYGFSGSGFSQVLLAMNDPRIMALADIESALYGEAIWDIFSSSDYYDASKLRIPFLHIYGKYLGMSDTNFEEFYKIEYAHHYHLLLNQPGLHHWDVATEGRASTTILHQRGASEQNIKASFELANIYLLNFFNVVLKKDQSSQQILNTKSSVTTYNDSLWSIQQYPALEPPPDKNQFQEVIKRKGIDEAIKLAKHFKEIDSTADFIHENSLNHVAQILQSENKLKDGIKLQQTAKEFYPYHAWLWRNLGDMQEADNDVASAIKSYEKVMALLKDVPDTGSSFDTRIKRSAETSLKRLRDGN